jgi:hypothetical protein
MSASAVKLFLISISLLFSVLLLSGCLPSKTLTVASAGILLEEVAKASTKQSDLKMIREGMPAYLMLMDGMIEAWPDNERLLIAAAQGYSSFASVIADEQEKEYEKQLYGKAKQYALRALEMRGVKDPLQRPLDDFKEDLKNLGKKDVPSLFWAATCWASWINLNLDSIEALAELPRVEWMMQRVLELDEGFYYGGPHLFMGVLLASKPRIAGGDLEKARAHFLRAFDLGQGKFLMAYVYYADTYARKVLDKALFTSTLQSVLESPVDRTPELTLLNTVAKKKAQELLGRTGEYFD